MTSSKELPPFTSPFFPNLFIKNQFFTKPRFPPQSTNLSDKVAIVTGSNTGLGFECARQLLSHKLSTLIIAVRSSAKGEAAASSLRKQFPKSNIEVWQLDMSSYGSVQAFAARLDKELSRLDIAILNAGMGRAAFGTSPDTGHEENVQVNYLSTMLLSILLLPILKNKSPVGFPGRLTIVTSMLSITAKFAVKSEVPLLPAFDRADLFDPLDNYPTSKLLGQLFIWKLTDVVSADDVVVNLVEPGFVKGTELQRDIGGATRIILNLFKSISARSVKVGASTYMDAAIIKGKESHGCVIMNWDIAPYAPFQYTAKGKEIMKRLWEETLNEFKFIDVNSILGSLKTV
ncbi:hypothetical protein V8C40DRAFT_259101 [Trichoderma camerunense]